MERPCVDALACACLALGHGGRVWVPCWGEAGCCLGVWPIQSDGSIRRKREGKKEVEGGEEFGRD